MASMSVSDLRAQLRSAMARVEAGEVLEITRDGEVAAVLIHPSLLQRRVRTPAVLAAEKLHEELEAARARPFRVPRKGLRPGRADELVRQIRADRDRRR